MGDDKLADIPGNHFLLNRQGLAAVASNAEAVRVLGTPRAAGVVASADIIPETSQAGSATNYVDVNIVNLGSDGNGTTVLASKSFSGTASSVDALAPGAFTLAADPSFAAGEVLAVSTVSQGNGIALVAHGISLQYRLT